MPQIRGVLLDVDGTLIDSNDAHAHAWVEALAEVGYQVPFEKVRPPMGMGSDNLLPAVVDITKETPKGQQASAGWERIFKQKYLPHLKPFPQAQALLQHMRAQGLKLVVASSAKEAMLESLLELIGAKDLIEGQTSSDDAKNSKPDPDIVHAALTQIGLPPAQVVMLGDTPYDIQAAGKAGVQVIALRCGGWDDPGLPGALAIYDDPADLLKNYATSPLALQAY
jgi:HAD superfamily hydrolase (TIGR01509 family)